MLVPLPNMDGSGKAGELGMRGTETKPPSVPLILKFLWLQELNSLCGAIGGGHGYRRRITMPLNRQAWKQANGPRRRSAKPIGPINNTWAVASR